MEEMCKDFLAKMQAAAAKDPSLEEVKSKHVPHGKLVGCSYYASSSGMQYNSNTLLNISVVLTDGVQKISYVNKPAFQSTTATVYQPKQDILETLQALVERENLAAWSALEYHNPFQCTDYSSSASITLTFDDTSVGGVSRTSVSINVDAACQHSGGDVIQEFRDILETIMQDAEVLSQEVTEAPVYGLGMMGMMAAWKCPNCGCDTNTGKYCTECGTKNES